MRDTFRRLLVASTLAAPVAMLVCAPASAATAAPLSVEQVVAYRSTLDQAEASRRSLTRQATCLDGFIVEQQERSNRRERALGDARRREQLLLSQISREEEASKSVRPQNGVREGDARADDKQGALAQARQDSAADQNAIAEAENFISKTRAAVADLNVKIRAFDIRRDSFADMLDDINDLGFGDLHLRQVDRLSADLAFLASETPAFIASSEVDLPAYAKARCSL